MASLSAHLRRPADHGRLPFHPECPVCCRDRLTGELPSDALVGRRTQAVLAAGVLALSTATPSAVLAAEPDTEQEGATAPETAASQPAASAPDIDPGGASTDLPTDVAPVPAADPGPAPEAAGDDAGPVEQESATEDAAPVADEGDGTSVPAQAEQPAAPSPDVAPAPAPEVTPPEPPRSGAEAVPPIAATPTAPETDASRPHKQTRAKSERNDTSPPEPARVAPPPADAAPPSSTPSATPATVSASSPVEQHRSSTATRRARPGDRTHVVAPGESLWSIADDLLGDDASVARVAREVNRLWELNAHRIGTGNPSLVRVGTTLLL